MLIVFGTLTALFHKERTGEGQRVKASLLNSAIDFQCQEITAALNIDHDIERSDTGIASPVNNAPYGIYETVDGYVAIAMAPLDLLAELFDLPDLATYDGPRGIFEDRDEIKRQIEAETRTYETEPLLELCSKPTSGWPR